MYDYGLDHGELGEHFLVLTPRVEHSQVFLIFLLFLINLHARTLPQQIFVPNSGLWADRWIMIP